MANALFALIRRAALSAKTETGQKNAITKALFDAGDGTLPEITQGKVDREVARIYTWRNTPAGDFALVTGPSLKPVVQALRPGEWVALPNSTFPDPLGKRDAARLGGTPPRRHNPPGSAPTSETASLAPTVTAPSATTPTTTYPPPRPPRIPSDVPPRARPGAQFGTGVPGRPGWTPPPGAPGWGPPPAPRGAVSIPENTLPSPSFALPGQALPSQTNPANPLSSYRGVPYRVSAGSWRLLRDPATGNKTKGDRSFTFKSKADLMAYVDGALSVPGTGTAIVANPARSSMDELLLGPNWRKTETKPYGQGAFYTSQIEPAAVIESRLGLAHREAPVLLYIEGEPTRAFNSIPAAIAAHAKMRKKRRNPAREPKVTTKQVERFGMHLRHLSDDAYFVGRNAEEDLRELRAGRGSVARIQAAIKQLREMYAHASHPASPRYHAYRTANEAADELAKIIKPFVVRNNPSSREVVFEGNVTLRGTLHDVEGPQHGPGGGGAHQDRLHGGVADDLEPEDFDQEDLDKGTEHEMEHTDDPELAQEIAMDHLAEDPDYYEKLEAIEEGEVLPLEEEEEEESGEEEAGELLEFRPRVPSDAELIATGQPTSRDIEAVEAWEKLVASLSPAQARQSGGDLIEMGLNLLRNVAEHAELAARVEDAGTALQGLIESAPQGLIESGEARTPGGARPEEAIRVGVWVYYKGDMANMPDVGEIVDVGKPGDSYIQVAWVRQGSTRSVLRRQIIDGIRAWVEDPAGRSNYGQRYALLAQKFPTVAGQQGAIETAQAMRVALEQKAEEDKRTAAQTDAEVGPYFGNLATSLQTNQRSTELRRKDAAAILRKFLNKHGLKASITTPSYSMASGINVHPPKGQKAWTQKEAELFERLLPGTTRVYTNNEGERIRTVHDWWQALHPGSDKGWSFRVATDMVPEMSKLIAQQMEKAGITLNSVGQAALVSRLPRKARETRQGSQTPSVASTPSVPSASVTVVHTEEGGTLALGDTKPVKDILKRYGFRWSRANQFWYIPRSRGKQKSPINLDALRAELGLLDLRPDEAEVEAQVGENYDVGTREAIFTAQDPHEVLDLLTAYLGHNPTATELRNWVNTVLGPWNIDAALETLKDRREAESKKESSKGSSDQRMVNTLWIAFRTAIAPFENRKQTPESDPRGLQDLMAKMEDYRSFVEKLPADSPARAEGLEGIAMMERQFKKATSKPGATGYEAGVPGYGPEIEIDGKIYRAARKHVQIPGERELWAGQRRREDGQWYWDRFVGDTSVDVSKGLDLRQLYRDLLGFNLELENEPGRLDNIKVLWRRPDHMTLWGIPYKMKADIHQAPSDIVRGHGGYPPSNWVQLDDRDPEIRAHFGDAIPTHPNEFTDLADFGIGEPQELASARARGLLTALEDAREDFAGTAEPFEYDLAHGAKEPERLVSLRRLAEQAKSILGDLRLLPTGNISPGAVTRASTLVDSMMNSVLRWENAAVEAGAVQFAERNRRHDWGLKSPIRETYDFFQQGREAGEGGMLSFEEVADPKVMRSWAIEAREAPTDMSDDELKVFMRGAREGATQVLLRDDARWQPAIDKYAKPAWLLTGGYDNPPSVVQIASYPQYLDDLFDFAVEKWQDDNGSGEGDAGRLKMAQTLKQWLSSAIKTPPAVQKLIDKAFETYQKKWQKEVDDTARNVRKLIDAGRLDEASEALDYMASTHPEKADLEAKLNELIGVGDTDKMWDELRAIRDELDLGGEHNLEAAAEGLDEVGDPLDAEERFKKALTARGEKEHIARERARMYRQEVEHLQNRLAAEREGRRYNPRKRRR